MVSQCPAVTQRFEIDFGLTYRFPRELVAQQRAVLRNRQFSGFFNVRR